ncbi:hypothetical protein [Halonotius pteroides]|uniref:DUF8116 domain-containing protein n=1 Tax=Halonotius pteroides TaxID=268735 RepID=A0A3A6QMZ0_9EURY|nr:hypothetical protein [Halonotius pteroides]RJX49536.1 hypothetical protein DP106_08695 [Halonotius pteroides]
MSVLSLLRLYTAADFADWYRIGAEYVDGVAEEMGFDTAEFVDYEAGVAAMRDGRPPASVSPAVRRSIAADLLADAVFSEPFCEWLPLWYEVSLLGPVRYCEYRLRAVAEPYCHELSVSVPRFSRPANALVDGRPAPAHLDSFREQFILADAILHLEWFVHVARESGIVVPQGLIDRTHEESLAYYTGHRESLSPQVQRFQAALFADDRWVREIDAAYGLDSTLFELWERLLRAERERLEAATQR